MKRRTEVGLCAVVAVLLASMTAMAVNSVVVESKNNLPLNATNVEVGVFISNDDSLAGLALPLVVRSVSGGAFWAPGGPAKPITMPAANRLGASALGFDQDAIVTNNTYRDTGSCTGGNCAVANPSTFRVPGALDFVTPDGMFLVTIATTIEDPCMLPPGSDPPGTANASIILKFNVNGSIGTFEIDTACMCPANHLAFARQPEGCGGPPLRVVPSFVKGYIGIGQAGCDCSCHGDPVCDNVSDVLDVVQAVVSVAFGGVADIVDPACPHIGRTDVNCDCATEVRDVVKFVDVVFRGDTTRFCDPCVSPCAR